MNYKEHCNGIFPHSSFSFQSNNLSNKTEVHLGNLTRKVSVFSKEENLTDFVSMFFGIKCTE